MAPTLVLLHGFTHTGASWAPVVGALGERYRALAPDIRGHGASAELRPVQLDAVVSDVAGLTVGRFVLAGYSMGGRIALHVALAHPKRVARLFLVGASAGIGEATGQLLPLLRRAGCPYDRGGRPLRRAASSMED